MSSPASSSPVPSPFGPNRKRKLHLVERSGISDPMKDVQLMLLRAGQQKRNCSVAEIIEKDQADRANKQLPHRRPRNDTLIPQSRPHALARNTLLLIPRADRKPLSCPADWWPRFTDVLPTHSHLGPTTADGCGEWHAPSRTMDMTIAPELALGAFHDIVDNLKVAHDGLRLPVAGEKETTHVALNTDENPLAPPKGVTGKGGWQAAYSNTQSAEPSARDQAYTVVTVKPNEVAPFLRARKPTLKLVQAVRDQLQGRMAGRGNSPSATPKILNVLLQGNTAPNSLYAQHVDTWDYGMSAQSGGCSTFNYTTVTLISPESHCAMSVFGADEEAVYSGLGSTKGFHSALVHSSEWASPGTVKITVMWELKYTSPIGWDPTLYLQGGEGGEKVGKSVGSAARCALNVYPQAAH